MVLKVNAYGAETVFACSKVNIYGSRTRGVRGKRSILISGERLWF